MSNYSDKRDSDVTIAGKVYTLTGYESEEYLRSDGFRRLPVETQNVLMLLNIADDYFKAKEQLDQLLSDLEKRDKEAYDLKHNLVVQMTKMEDLEKTFKELQEENSRNQRKVIELEAELRGRDRMASANSRRK